MFTKRISSKRFRIEIEIKRKNEYLRTRGDEIFITPQCIIISRIYIINVPETTAIYRRRFLTDGHGGGRVKAD